MLTKTRTDILAAPTDLALTVKKSHKNGGGRGRRSVRRPDLYIKGLAQKCGVSDGYMSWVVSGKRNPSMKLAAKMAAVMGKEIRELAAEFGWTSLRGTIFFDEKARKRELADLKK